MHRWSLGLVRAAGSRNEYILLSKTGIGRRLWDRSQDSQYAGTCASLERGKPAKVKGRHNSSGTVAKLLQPNALS
ncbi:Protein of unknown function [Pyronema omphalodes CBS 100304]|uniref:Uncharacterized protein n=1 Tax=Pyronema omphalodes (strain CBS 100304) TaxID=1076935 RepID=U4KY99_PYROM|nr:Protein of unknown function [Pyronema omphalodes CBS 100304]